MSKIDDAMKKYSLGSGINPSIPKIQSISNTQPVNNEFCHRVGYYQGYEAARGQDPTLGDKAVKGYAI